MKSSTAILALAGSLSCAFAAPQGTAFQGFPLPPADTPYYYFRTSVLPNQTEKYDYDHLYMTAYHTGAGTSDVTFQSEPLNGHRGWFNGSSLRWFQPTKPTDAPFGLTKGSGTTYDYWYPVAINGGEGSGHFVLDSNMNLVVTKDGSISNWLVCDGSHNAPQLYNTVSYAADVPIPDTCAKVNLVAELAPPLLEPPTVNINTFMGA
ncbi:hypothetical protein FKW77_001189 [Venturia effusa]|uniref:DUF7907 domain-containing protein n=1 Tax=Venturia effusa TaxID=50376 RepID=A0A517KZ03_9PEZI|nr:hypothetical protein FKW77_001189 [Venturia effusa]